MTAVVARRQLPVRGGRSLRRAAVVVAFLVLGTGALVAWWSVDSSPGTAGGLGAVSADGPVREYTIVYETRHADAAPIIERLEVQRPFRSWFTSSTSTRVTDAGSLSTSSDGERWLTIEVPIAPAGSDLRPLAVLDDAADGGIVELVDHRSVGERSCRAYRLGGPVSSGSLTPVGAVPGESAEVCVDELGLVLSETWWVDGEIARTREAVSLQVGTLSSGRPHVPDDAVVLPPADGGGAVEPVDPDAPPGFVEYWRPERIPPGFRFVDRWAVVPPALGGVGAPGAPPSGGVALVTDVWTRGPDLLVLDQGARRPGVGPPWDESVPGAEVELGDLGTGTLVLDLRMSEVRVRRPDEGFVRVAGTLPPDELVALARSIVPDPSGAPS